MKANAGGQIAPDEVVGREALITSLWEILEQQSVILSAERRMGKTCVIKKMKAEAPSDKLAIYHDLEKVRSPLEFVEAIFQDVEEYLSKRQKVASGTRKLLKDLSGLEIKGFKLPKEIESDWKKILVEIIADVVANKERQVILLWDEIPYMLQNIGDRAAMEVLDTLRSLRQTYPDVRMVFTGSIGLHHVIASLKETGYTNEPTNDMYPQDVPPISEPDAIELAVSLLEGENIRTSNLQETAKAIAQAVNCIPFYIHHLVRKLKTQTGTVEPRTINEVINNCLLDPLNPWKMDHYQDRIDNYYNDEQRPYALNLLDILSKSDESLLFDELLNRLRLESATQDKEIARAVLRLLERDYYLIRRRDLKYCFRYPLIKGYWQILRG
jgi:AAA domain